MYNRLAVEGLGMRLGSYHSIKLQIQITLAKAFGDLDEITKIGSNPYMWELAPMTWHEKKEEWKNRGTTETSFNECIILCNVLVWFEKQESPFMSLCWKKDFEQWRHCICQCKIVWGHYAGRWKVTFSEGMMWHRSERRGKVPLKRKLTPYRTQTVTQQRTQKVT